MVILTISWYVLSIISQALADHDTPKTYTQVLKKGWIAWNVAEKRITTKTSPLNYNISRKTSLPDNLPTAFLEQI